MTSVASFFAPPTATPLAFYSPGLTGLNPARPAFSTAFEWFLQRILSFTTTGFKWLTIGNISRRTLKLSATPTSEYYPKPTKTVIVTTVNHSLAISLITAFAFIVSLLFGAGVVYFGRRGGSSGSSSTAYRQKAKKANSSPKSTTSPTLFHQDDTVSPLVSYMHRLSSFWVSALSFVLRGLAFLFRLIAMEKLLDVVEDNAADHETAASVDSHIAESRVLDKGHVLTTPTQTDESPARFSDANKTLVAPFTPYAKSKLGQVILPSSDDKVDVILLPKEIKACTPTCIDIDPASFRKATIDPAEGGEGTIPSLPASSRRSFRSRPIHPLNTIVTPHSVEPSGVPDIPLPTSPPVYKPSYQPFRRVHVTSGDLPSTPPRNSAVVSPSVEPSGVPDEADARVNRPNRFISPAVADLFGKIFPLSPTATSASRFEGGEDVIPRLPASTRRSSFRIRPTHSLVAPLSVEPSGVPLTTSSPVHKSSYQPFRRIYPTSGDRPSTPPSKSAAVSSSVEPSGVPDRVVALESRAESSSEAADARVNRPSRFTEEEIDARLKATRERLTLGKLLSSRLAAGGKENLRLSRFAFTRSTGAEAPLKDQTQPLPLGVAPKNTNVAETDLNLAESVAEVRERVRRTMERAREAAEATDLRIRTKFPPRESRPPLHRPKPKSTGTDPQTTNQETPRDKAREAMAQIRRDHEDLLARVQATLKRCDERRELWAAKARSREVDKVQTGPGSKRPVSTLFSKYPKYRSLTDPEEIGLSGHRIQPGPDQITAAEQSASSAGSSWIHDHIPEATDDES